MSLVALTALLVGTAASARSLEDDVLRTLNDARANPAAYARSLRSYRQNFDGRVVHDSATGPGVQTFEGVTAVDEAIDFLERQQPLAPLMANTALARAASDQARDQSTSGATGHRGSDGSMPPRRIERYGKWQGTAAEAISYGSTSGEDVVRQLIVDDGVPSRAHRTTLFNPELHVAGVACRPHPRYGAACVIDMATGMAAAPPR